MRVLLISRGDVFPPFHGAASRIANTAKYLSRESCEVFFLPSQSDRYYIFRNAQVEEVQFSPFLRDLRSDTSKIDGFSSGSRYRLRTTYSTDLFWQGI